MFSTTEFVKVWNEIFSFKIKETDLAKPTEAFVFDSLIDYLKMFNFDTCPMLKMKNSTNVSEKRAFLVRFCNYIDHIYKISDKSHCFLIYDLKHPSPKKTVHMLNHLLNYYFYYKMFKDSIVPLADGKILEWQHLMDKIKKYNSDHEQIANRAKVIEKHIKNLLPLAPQTLDQLNKIIDAEASQREAITYLEAQLQECNSVLESLLGEEARLSRGVVSKEEVDRLKSHKTILENGIDEQLVIERATFKKIQDRSVAMVKLQNIMSSIDSAMDCNSPALLKSHKDCVQKYKELESKFVDINQRKETFKSINEKLVEDLNKLEKDCNLKNNQLAKMKISSDKQIEEKKMLAESNEAAITELEHELQNTEKQLAEEKHVTEYILETTALLVRATMNNSNDN